MGVEEVQPATIFIRWGLGVGVTISLGRGVPGLTALGTRLSDAFLLGRWNLGDDANYAGKADEVGRGFR